eukprot:16021865-Heterocapsa_arctica.AAC.1
MEHDVDERELANSNERTTNRSEWGGYVHIIMWSKIFHIKIRIYCYSMNMQTIDGDEFTQDKECIILLYCNKSRWGETKNNYDLMHPIVQQ